MSGEIASLLVKLGLDSRDFTAGIANANKTTATFGQGLLTKGNIAKAGFGAMAAGLGVVTVAAAQAERAQGDFMAATGATRDEAKSFVSGMDSLAGSAGAIGESFDQIAATGTMVQQQFHTTGQATTDLTSQLLDFSKVVGGDAAENSKQLAEVLDAYHLKATDAAGVTDQLVASVQKYGTNAPEMLTNLQKMAPALSAMGLGLDQGVGLLNMFKSAGIDAASVQRGLNTAITKLPPGTSLDDFVKHLSDLKSMGIDPTAEAIKVFGNKAGAALALAIKPGMTGLDDFGTSAQDAAGKTQQAANDMLTTGDKIKGLADKFLAGAREIGQNFGPALTGAASLVSLTAPFVKGFAKLGVPAAKAFGTAFSKNAGKFITAGKALGSKLIGPLSAAVAGAMSRLAGSPAIAGAMDKLGGFMGGRLGGGMATAFKAAGILALIAVAIQEWGDLQKQIDANKKAAAGIDKATGDYLAGMPSPQDVQAKIDALKQVPQSLTGIQGALYNLGSLGEGNVIGSAFDALFGANPAQVADDKIKQMEDYLKTTGADNVSSGVDAVATAIAPDGADAVSKSFDDLVQSWEDGSKALIANGEQLAGFDPQVGQWVTGQDFLDAAPDIQDSVQTWIDAQNKAIDKGAADDAKALDQMRSMITDKLQAVQDAFDTGIDTKKKKNISGADRLKQMAQDIDAITKNMNQSIAANDPVNTAYWESALIDATNKYNTAKGDINVDANQIATDVATATQSAGADMTQLGNTATDAAGTVNQAAQDVNMNPAVNTVASAAGDMHDSFMHIGTYASNVPGAIQANVAPTHTAADHMAQAIEGPLDALNPQSWGSHLAHELAAGMRIGNTTISSAAAHWANLLSNTLGFSAPPEEGPLHDVPHWGPHMVDLWARTTTAHARLVVPKAANYLAGLMAKYHITPPLQAPETGHGARHHHNHLSNPSVAADGTTGAGDNITVNVTVQGNVYGNGGVKQLATDLENYIKRSKRGGARLVGAF